MYMESMFTAEATIQKQQMNGGICYNIKPISGIPAGYRGTQSANRMIDSRLP